MGDDSAAVRSGKMTVADLVKIFNERLGRSAGPSVFFAQLLRPCYVEFGASRLLVRVYPANSRPTQRNEQGLLRPTRETPLFHCLARPNLIPCSAASPVGRTLLGKP